MGMFDYVDAPDQTCSCGATVKDWQSKDGDCQLELLPADAVSNYYTFCEGCGAWWEFNRIDGVWQGTVDPSGPKVMVWQGTVAPK